MNLVATSNPWKGDIKPVIAICRTPIENMMRQENCTIQSQHSMGWYASTLASYSFYLFILLLHSSPRSVLVRWSNPKNDAASTEQVILVEDGKVKAIGHGLSIPPNAQIFDLSKETVLPGLIDAHTHLCGVVDAKWDLGTSGSWRCSGALDFVRLREPQMLGQCWKQVSRRYGTRVHWHGLGESNDQQLAAMGARCSRRSGRPPRSQDVHYDVRLEWPLVGGNVAGEKGRSYTFTGKETWLNY